MRILTNKSTIQKIAIIVLIAILFSFAVPMTVNAAEWNAGKLLTPFMDLFRAIGDIVLGGLQKFMLGTEKAYGSLMVSSDDVNVARMQKEAEDLPR